MDAAEDGERHLRRVRQVGKLHRARNLRKRRVTGFEDRFGTSLIFMVMTTAVLANLVVTLVHSFNRYEIDRFQYRSGVS